ncbi:MAG: TIGR03086 family protein [Geodermatophilaceae bacterium]|nr:TIGR03086 family protein [Geodermatophilaceae bacterium]MDQ3456284.1 TIGR03086 family metal-binding protein [Actinomycetota bacterium]
MTDTFDLGPATKQMQRLVAGVREDQLADPTPCEGTTVGALMGHINMLSAAFRACATKEELPGLDQPPPPPSADNLPADWRTSLPTRLGALAEAWRDPAAWQGMATAGGVTMPSAVMATVALDEVVLHGWDLARATVQPFEVDPVSTEVVLGFTSAMTAPEEAAGREGLFGPVVPVPDDAPAFDRALGNAGRDPHWRP